MFLGLVGLQNSQMGTIFQNWSNTIKLLKIKTKDIDIIRKYPK